MAQHTLSPPKQVFFVVTTPNGFTSTIPMSGSSFVIGRDPSCQLRPRNAYVSRRHAEIFWENDELFLRDLGSSNGTFLSGSAVTTVVPVADNDRVEIGPFKLLVKVGKPPNNGIAEGVSEEKVASWLFAEEEHVEAETH